MNLKKRWLILAAIVFLAAVASGVFYFHKSSAPTEFEVGAILPLTGNLAALGEPKREAMQLALDEINRAGGVDGRKLVLRLEDNKGEPKEGVSILQKLLDIDRIRFFYVDITAVALSTAPIASSRGVIMFAGSAHPSITEGYKGVFRIFTSGAQEARLLSRYLAAQGVKSVYVLYVDDALGQETRVVFANEFSALGGQVIGADKFRTGEQEFRSVLAKVRTSGADRVAIFDYGVTLPQILRQALQIGIPSQKIVGNIGFVGPGVVRLEGAYKEGVVFTGPAFTYRMMSDSRSKEMERFIREYETRYKKLPDYTAAFAYDTSKILALAMKGTAGDVEKVRQNLLRVRDFPGVSGNITILPNGDSSTDMILASYKAGKIVKEEGVAARR